MLPNDFEEFCHLVPQSGIRMKLKVVIEKYSTVNNYSLKVNQKVSIMNQYFVNTKCSEGGLCT